MNFKHVRAHTGVVGNEMADQLAARGVLGYISPHARAWTERPAVPMGQDPRPPAPKRAPRQPAPMRRPAAAKALPMQGRWTLHTCLSCNEISDLVTCPNISPLAKGPDPAHRTCKYCPAVLQIVQARKNHERYSRSHEALRDGLITSLLKRRTGRGAG